MMLISIVLLLVSPYALCVRITELQVPPRAIVGGEAVLSCVYELGDNNLHSIKWYKNGREFYRYLPSHLERGIPSAYSYIETPGVAIDRQRSSANEVTLVNLTLQATGAYSCEVTGEAPQFVTHQVEGYLNVYLTPVNPPEITGLRPQYKPGEKLLARCTIYGTQPEINLQFFLNGEPVDKQYAQGPYRRVSMLRNNSVDTVIQLSFTVLQYDFINGKLTAKCVASLPPVYESEVTKIVELQASQYEEEEFNEEEESDEQEPSFVYTTPTNSGTTISSMASKFSILVLTHRILSVLC